MVRLHHLGALRSKWPAETRSSPVCLPFEPCALTRECAGGNCGAAGTMALVSAAGQRTWTAGPGCAGQAWPRLLRATDSPRAWRLRDAWSCRPGSGSLEALRRCPRRHRRGRLPPRFFPCYPWRRPRPRAPPRSSASRAAQVLAWPQPPAWASPLPPASGPPRRSLPLAHTATLTLRPLRRHCVMWMARGRPGAARRCGEGSPVPCLPCRSGLRGSCRKSISGHGRTPPLWRRRLPRTRRPRPRCRPRAPLRRRRPEPRCRRRTSRALGGGWSLSGAWTVLRAWTFRLRSWAC
mmetsp:Transcript_119662/g.381895  ORF Transcript_119662/g.381895 Transcript_119662/m.381895 type:complete len:293 (-) Transcript_119662:2733-3611(-)